LTSVIAHRGASAYEVENSLAAFSRAVAQGADGVELDVHTTADGIPVVLHNEVAGNRLIRETCYDELRDHKLANGEAIPSLAAALSMLGTAIDVFVEVKALPAAHDSALLAALAEGPAPHRYRIHSFDHRIVKRIRMQRPSLPAGVLSVSYPIDPVTPVQAASATTLWQQEGLIDADLITALHREGYSVYAWTVDEPARIRHLVELGVDAICTNRPDVGRQSLG